MTEDNSAVAAYEEMRGVLAEQNLQLLAQLDADHSRVIADIKKHAPAESAALWLIFFSLRIAAMAEKEEL